MQSVPTLAQHVGATLAQRQNIFKITLAQRWPTVTIMVGIMLGQCWQRFLFMVRFCIDKTDTLKVLVRLDQHRYMSIWLWFSSISLLIAQESLSVLLNPKRQRLLF